jgi:hypothetical protein
MPITFNCPGCGKGYTVPDAVGGKSSKCRACGAAVKIPLSSEAAAPMPAAAPAPRSRSGGGFPIKKIALVAVAFLVVVALGYGGWSLLSGGGGSAGMKFMPDNTRILVSVRPADYMKSGVWAEIKKEMPEADKILTDSTKEAPFQVEDVSQVLVGVGDYTKEEAVIAIEFKKAVKLDDVIAFLNKTAGGKQKTFTEEKVGSYTIKADKEVSLCQVSDKLIVGGSPSALKAVLERDKKPAFTDGLQKALKDADLSQTVSVVFDVKPFASDPMIGGTAKGAGIDVSSVESAVINIAVTSDVKVNAIAQCKDAKTAEEYRKMAEGGVLMAKKALGAQMPKDVIDIIDALKVKDKDKQLTAEVAIKVAPLIPLAKQALGGFGQRAEKAFDTVGQEIGGAVGNPGDFKPVPGKVIGKIGGPDDFSPPAKTIGGGKQ